MEGNKMKSLEIVDAALDLLGAQEALRPYPGLKELIQELKALRHRLKHRLHRRSHNGFTTEVIEVEGLELVVDYTYTAALPAPRCSNPSDPAFSIPPEPAEVDIRHVWSHDDLRDFLSPRIGEAMEAKVLALEEKYRGER
jgi:hypothetical protein